MNDSPRSVTAALVVAVIGFAVQQTAIVPAIADVQSSLHASAEWSAWLVTVYLTVATVATLAMGRLGDLHGRRRMLVIGLVVFAISSVGAALAPSILVLICFRALQGVGGAVYPLALSIVRDRTPDDRVTGAIAVLTAAFGVGTALGFVGGGLLAEYVSWRAIFGAGAVLVAAGAVLIVRRVPETAERAEGGFDLRGTVLLSIAAMALLTGFTLVVQLGWGSPVSIALFVVTALAALAWARTERRVTDPLVDLHILRKRSVLVANLGTIGLGWALFGSYLLIPQFARTPGGSAGYGLGSASAAVGLLLLPLAFGQTLATLASARMAARIPARTSYAVGLAVITLAMAALAADRGSAAGVAVAAFVLGLGAGAALQSASAVATQDVRADVAAVSASVNSTVRRLAGGIGGQVSTILLASLVVAGGLPRFAAYTVAYVVAAAMCLVGSVLVATAG